MAAPALPPARDATPTGTDFWTVPDVTLVTLVITLPPPLAAYGLVDLPKPPVNPVGERVGDEEKSEPGESVFLALFVAFVCLSPRLPQPFDPRE